MVSTIKSDMVVLRLSFHSRRVPVQTSFSGTRIQYFYAPANLYWSYGSIVIGTGVVVILGLLSLTANGTSHDNLVSSFGAALQNPELSDLSAGHAVGSREVKENVLGKKVKLEEYDAGDRTGFWFVPQDEEVKRRQVWPSARNRKRTSSG